MVHALPWLAFVAVGAPLAWIDAKQHRLPNRLVAALTALALLTFGAVALGEGTALDLARAITGGVGLFLVLLLLAVIKPAAMGMGDVKLSFSIGVYLAWLGWAWLWWGTFAAFAAAALVGLLRRMPRHQTMALGPYLLGTVPLCAVASLWVSI